MEASKRRSGRPKKDPEKVKDRVIKFRAGDEEIEVLDALTKWAKMPRSEVLRILILESKNIFDFESYK